MTFLRDFVLSFSILKIGCKGIVLAGIKRTPSEENDLKHILYNRFSQLVKNMNKQKKTPDRGRGLGLKICSVAVTTNLQLFSEI